MPIITETITGDTPASVSVTQLTRSDTGATPSGVSLPLVMTAAGSVWSVTFADPLTPAPHTYGYRFLITWSDGSTSGPYDRNLAAEAGISGVYWTQSGVEQIYGAGNVAKWSQKDNNVDTLDATALAAAGSRVDNYINRRLRDFLYTSPLASTSRDFPSFQDAANELLGVYLYQGRGMYDEGGHDDRLKAHGKNAMNAIKNMLTRVSGIDGPRSASPAVTVIDPRTQAAADGYPVGFPSPSGW